MSHHTAAHARQRRRKQDKIFSVMSLNITAVLHQLHHRDGKSIGAIANDFLAAFAVHAHEPCTLAKIGKAALMHRRVAGRAVEQLIKHGFIEKKGGKYRVRDEYIEASLETTEQMEKIIAEICKAADAFRAL
jgi:DNA-binding MarR family transcriptional regulator